MYQISTAVSRSALLGFLTAVATTGMPANVGAQTCPAGPVAVNGTSCAVTPGTTIIVNSATIPGLDARNPGGQITANGITISLGPGTVPRTYVGAQVFSGAAIELNNTNINTIAPAATGQRGVISDGAGSQITGDQTVISLGAGTTVSDNLAVLAQNGGAVNFRNATISTLGGVNGIGNHAVTVTGVGSQVFLTDSTVSTASRASFGVQATAGGQATLVGTTVTTTGANTTTAPLTGSHALIANGTGSTITGTNLTLGTSGLLASAARAESGGLVTLSGTTINTSSTSSADTDPAAALRALSGGRLVVDSTTVTTTGSRGGGLSVEDSGSSIRLQSSSIDVSGNRANAALVQNGGSAEIAGSSLLSRGSTAVQVQGAGSTIDIGVGSVIHSQGAIGYGVKVITGGAATISNSTVLTENRDAVGLYTSNGSITANNVTVTTTGNDNSMGALADLGGTIVLNGGSITTSGNPVRAGTYANGLAARNPNGLLMATGTSVTTSGTLAFGVVADDGGTVILNDNDIRTFGDTASGLFSTVEQSGAQFLASITGQDLTVETSGNLAHGALASQHFLIAPSLIDLTGTSLTTHGAGSDGLRAIGSATINARTSAVLTEGAGSMGIHARDNASSVNIAATSVLTTGANAHGALANAGGRITGRDSTISATGADAYALYVAGAAGVVSRATFDNSRLSNVSGPAIAVGGVGEVTLTNSIVAGSSEWLRVGTITDFIPLAAPDAGPGGVLDPEGVELPTAFPPPAALPVEPGLADITLDASTVTGSAFTAPGSVSNLVMRNNSLWNMTGSSNVTTLLNDPSLIQFAAPTGDVTLLSSYMTLTVVNYVGEDGNIGLNTYLNTDGSPSDRLIIDGGSATGTSGLIIADTGGGGALTTGNGILVIDAINGGVTDPSAFSLYAPVIAGPYEYSLYRSSVDGTGPQNWYLRSELADDPDTPDYRPEVSLYAAIPSMAAIYGRHMIDTLHERVGEEEQLKGRIDIGEDEKFNGYWLRAIGHWGHRDGDPRGIYDGAPAYDYRFGAIQGGLDFYRNEKDGITDHAGMYLAYGHGVMDVTQNRLTTTRNAGQSTFNAFSVGGYWTRFGENGWYLDGVLQGTWYDVITKSNRETEVGFRNQNVDGFGFAASLEGGYPFDLGDGWQIEPQAQIIWQTIHIGGFNDGAADIHYDNLNSLVGRLGARVARTWKAEEEHEGEPSRLATMWGRVNLWHEFTAKAQTDISSENGFVPFSADLNETWIEVGIGATRQLSKNMSVYGNLNFSTTFDGDNYAWNGKVGLRVNW
ncbi:Autotransporter [Neorhizobium galegae bv. orientalis]|nr:Autotransporter [Neorhizobium galegae bv. orientalis]